MEVTSSKSSFWAVFGDIYSCALSLDFIKHRKPQRLKGPLWGSGKVRFAPSGHFLRWFRIRECPPPKSPENSGLGLILICQDIRCGMESWWRQNIHIIRFFLGGVRKRESGSYWNGHRFTCRWTDFFLCVQFIIEIPRREVIRNSCFSVAPKSFNTPSIWAKNIKLQAIFREENPPWN